MFPNTVLKFVVLKWCLILYCIGLGQVPDGHDTVVVVSQNYSGASSVRQPSSELLNITYEGNVIETTCKILLS